MTEALKAGYRTSTTPPLYGNEAGVGAASRLRDPPRGALRHHQAVEQRPGLRQHAARVRHQPGEAGSRLRGPVPDPLALTEPTRPTSIRGRRWRRSPRRAGPRIGVSNFLPEHLSASPTAGRARGQPDRDPPGAAAARLPGGQRRHGMATEAWSPLAQGGVLEDPVVDCDRRRRTAHPGAGGPPLAPAARPHPDPEVGDPGADRRELRRLRLRAQRGRARGHRRAGA